MSIIKEYLKVFGDRAIIQINDSDGIPMGYYAGSIKFYESCWERAKFYKTKESAKQIARNILSENFTIIMMSELIK